MRKAAVLTMLAFLFILIPVQSQSSNTSISCLDSTNARLFINQTICSAGDCEVMEYSETIECPYGCDTTGSNDCKPDPTETIQYSFVAAAAFVFIIIMLLWLSHHANENSLLKPLFFFLSLDFVFGLIVMLVNIMTLANSVVVAGLFRSLLFPFQMLIYLFIIFMIFDIFSQAIEYTKAKKQKRIFGDFNLGAHGV